MDLTTRLVHLPSETYILRYGGAHKCVRKRRWSCARRCSPRAPLSTTTVRRHSRHIGERGVTNISGVHGAVEDMICQGFLPAGALSLTTTLAHRITASWTMAIHNASN